MPTTRVQKYLAIGAARVEGEAGREKVILTLEGVDTTPDRPVVFIEVNAPLTTEAEAEETILRVRRSTVTGTEVGKLAEKIAASTSAGISFSLKDEPGEVAGLKYVLTAEQRRATKKDTFISPSLEASV